VPVQVQGISELRSALRSFAPDMEKNLNKQVRASLQPVVKNAKGYVVTPSLSHWVYKGGKSNKITKQTSSFRRGKFPLFNASIVKAGIVAVLSPTKKNRNGFVTNYSIQNRSAAGAIMETAGRKNPEGQPWRKGSASHKYSHSNNPHAGQRFISGQHGQLKGEGKQRGRLIYRAWDENQGRALGNIMKAVDATILQFGRRVDAASGFKDIAA
jgi:hypothetical protein